MDNKEIKNKQKQKIEDQEVENLLDPEFDDSVDKIKSDLDVQVPESPREKVDEDLDFGAMSQEIASKVKENLPEEQVQDTRIEGVMSEVEQMSGGHKLDEFLEDIGITRKQFYIFLSIVVCFIFGVIVSFYYLLSWFAATPEDIGLDDPVVEPPVVEEEGPSVFERFGDWIGGLFESDQVDDPLDDPVVEDPIVEPPVVDDKTDSGNNSSNDDSKDDPIVGVDLNNVVGNQVESIVDTESIELGYLIGTSQKQENRLSEYIRTYRELRAVFNTDLFSYLSVVEDREKGFDEYLTRLKGVNQKSVLAREDLILEIAEYQARLEVIDQELDTLEGGFFGELEALNSEAVPSLLIAFQEVGKKEVVVSSELKARQAILDRYNSAEGVVDDRIKAIELNKDAFVKGVQVVDYKNIDLELIINQ